MWTFTKVSVARSFHSSGPKLLELKFGSDLDQRGRLLNRPFLFWSEYTEGCWGYKPTERKAKLSPVTGLSVMLNFWLSSSCGCGKVSFTVNRVVYTHDQSSTNKWSLKRLFRWKIWNGKSWFTAIISPLVLKVSYMKREEAETWHPGNSVPIAACVSWWMCTASS